VGNIHFDGVTRNTAAVAQKCFDRVITHEVVR